MANCDSKHTFQNWSHTLEFRPRQFCKPRTEAEVVDLVNAARARSGCLRTQGAGHSFSQLLPTEDTLVSLDDLDDGGLEVGQDQQVTVSAGARIKELVQRLAARGLGLQNMGSITEQSIAGATATGTHGTGLGLGSLSTQIVGATLVDGQGNVVVLDKGDSRLKAASLSVGALGILTNVRLQCVDHYRLEYNAYVGKFDEVMANLDTLAKENVRVLLWWLVPLFKRDDVVIITKNPPAWPAGILGMAEDRAAPPPLGVSATPLDKRSDALWTFVAAQGMGGGKGFKRIWHMEDDYSRILTLPLLPIFHTECEYAIPYAETVPAMQALRKIVEENDFDLKLPVEVRFTAADDILLSPANKGPVCFIGASTEKNTAEVFARFEPLMRRHGGRPHWGKHFTLTRDDIKGLYGKAYDDFVAIREAFDPDRVFANSLLLEIFG